MRCRAVPARASEARPRGAWWSRIVLAACLACAAGGNAFGAGAPAPASDTASGAAPGLAPESNGFRQAAERERDAETLQTLTAEGRLLLSRDHVTLPAYDYCSMSVSAAERGDFRDSVEAASRALVMAQRTDNADLAALSKRDLAIAYSYAGDLEDAERYAKEALASTPKAPEQVFAPAYKVLGDVALRRNQPQEAITDYNHALETASPRYRPLVLISVTNAQIAAGDTAGARKTFDAASPPPTADSSRPGDASKAICCWPRASPRMRGAHSPRCSPKALRATRTTTACGRTKASAAPTSRWANGNTHARRSCRPSTIRKRSARAFAATSSRRACSATRSRFSRWRSP
jgi:tetratricopeptide (TPR) repeat protein